MGVGERHRGVRRGRPGHDDPGADDITGSQRTKPGQRRATRARLNDRSREAGSLTPASRPILLWPHCRYPARVHTRQYSQTMSEGRLDSPLVTSLSFSRRVFIMAAVVVGSTPYSTTLLVAAAILPQMQGSK